MKKVNWFTEEKVEVNEQYKCSVKDCLINTDGYCTGLQKALPEDVCNFYKPMKINRWRVVKDTDTRMYECPDCGCRMIADPYDKAVGSRGYNFCPYCGKNMR